MSTIKDRLKKLQQLADQHGGFKIEVYGFVLAALNYTLEHMTERRHVTGRELLDGIRSYGRDQYGPMALTVFDYWGISSTLDFGKVVFQLIDAGLMSKTDEDTLEDFRNVYTFEEAFDFPIHAALEE